MPGPVLCSAEYYPPKESIIAAEHVLFNEYAETVFSVETEGRSVERLGDFTRDGRSSLPCEEIAFISYEQSMDAAEGQTCDKSKVVEMHTYTSGFPHCRADDIQVVVFGHGCTKYCESQATASG